MEVKVCFEDSSITIKLEEHEKEALSDCSVLEDRTPEDIVSEAILHWIGLD